MALSAGAEGSGEPARGTGRGVRASLALQVGLACLLAAAVALLATWLAEWGPLHRRADLSQRGRNTLDPATLEQLAHLPEPARIDVFFRPLPNPYEQVGREVQELALDLVHLARDSAPDRVTVDVHDLSDLAGVEARMRELGLSNVLNTLVVSCGKRKEVLGLFEQLAVLDPGSRDPRSPRPPALASFRGEQALAESLARLASERGPRIGFSQGHGEPGLGEVGELGLAELARALRDDGSELVPWPAGTALPPELDVLALINPVQPLSDEELAAIRGWMARGGHLLVNLPTLFVFDGPNSAAALLGDYGIRAMPGLVCETIVNPVNGDEMDGLTNCARLWVEADRLHATHPVTAPLARHRRRILFPLTRSFERGTVPEGGIVLELAASDTDAWRDLGDPERGGQHDFAYDPAREEIRRFALCLAAEIPASGGDGGGGKRSRVLALASPAALGDAAMPWNGDFARNAFHWLAEREYQVRVSSRDPLQNRIDPARHPAAGYLAQVAWYGLPGLCAALGVLVAWWRRR